MQPRSFKLQAVNQKMSGIDSDKIIARQLKMIGFPGADQLTAMHSLSSNEFISMILFILKKVPNAVNQVSEPPKAPSALFKYTTSLVSLIQSLGYTEDLRYDHFLYPKQDNVRTLLSFLLEKVPRAGETATKTTSVVTPYSLAIQAVQAEFSAASKAKKPRTIEYTPTKPFRDMPISYTAGVAFSEQAGDYSLTSLLAENDRGSSLDQLNFFAQPSTSDRSLGQIAFRAFASVAASPVVSSSTQAHKTAFAKSRMANVARFEFGSQDTKIGTSAIPTAAAVVVPEAGKQEEADVKKLTPEQARTIKAEQRAETIEVTEELHEIEKQAEEMHTKVEEMKEKSSKVSVLLDTLKTENEKLSQELEKAVKIAKISSADSSQIRQLQHDLIDATSQIIEVANQFEQPRKTLISEARRLASAIKKRNETYQMQMTKLAKLKRQIQEGEEKLNQDNKEIEELNVALEEQRVFESRSEYINVIFDIIKTIEKQESEVERIRADIRSQHQRLNQTIETVKRTWSLLDETVYTEAKRKREDWSRTVYKTVVELLTLYESISEDVEEGGRISAQIMEIEAKIIQMESQIDRKAFERLENDLAEVKREIQRLQ